MKNIKVLIKFFVLIPLLATALGQRQCSTPYKKKGTCMQISQCLPIVKQLEGKDDISNREKNLIRSMSCHLKEDPTIICCPAEDDPNDPQIIFPRSEREMTLLPVAPNCGTIAKNVTSPDEQATTFYEYPWVALIEYTNYITNATEHFCTGSLVNNRYILTAAQCVTKVSKDWRITGVRLGDWDTSTNPDCTSKSCADPYREYKVENIYLHPNSTPTIVDGDDMALLYLSKSVEFSEFIQPICLPVVWKQEINDYLSQRLETAGWSDSEGPSNRKLKSRAFIWSLYDCQKAYVANKLRLHENQICAGNSEHDNISCYGDAGGPLMTVDSYSSMRAYVLAGVLSFGPASCGLKGYPNVFTKVGPNMEWIKSVYALN